MNFDLKLIYFFVVKRFIKKIISGEILFPADNLTKYNKNAKPTMAVRCQQSPLFLSQTYLFLNRAFPSLTVRPSHFLSQSFSLFQVSPSHFQSQTCPFFWISPSHFSKSVLLIFRLRLSHFYGSVLPTLRSQTFSFFRVSPSHFSKSILFIF